MDKRVETKAVAGSAGGLSGLILGDFLVWLVGVLWFAGQVPAPVETFIIATSVTVFGFAAAWLAPHTER